MVWGVGGWVGGEGGMGACARLFTCARVRARVGAGFCACVCVCFVLSIVPPCER